MSQTLNKYKYHKHSLGVIFIPCLLHVLDIMVSYFVSKWRQMHWSQI